MALSIALHEEGFFNEYMNWQPDTNRTIRECPASDRRVRGAPVEEQTLARYDEQLLKKILAKPYWTRRQAAKVVEINKCTVKNYVETLAIAVKDFRAQIPLDQSGNFSVGYSLTSYQLWVLSQVVKLMAQFRACQHGKAYFPEARLAIAKHQKYLSYQQFRYRCNLLSSGAA